MSVHSTQPAGLSSRKWTHDWTGFQLKDVLKEVEGKYLRDALRDAGGSVTKASKLLGFKHHQSFLSLLKKALGSASGTNACQVTTEVADHYRQ